MKKAKENPIQTPGGQICFTLPPAEYEALKAIALPDAKDASQIAAEVVSTWLGRFRISSIPKPIDEQAVCRLSILRRWWAAVPRWKGARVRATQQFILSLRGEGGLHSRSTLYQWEKRWANGGVQGLIDGRSLNHRLSIFEGDAKPFGEELRRLCRTTRLPRVSVVYAKAVAKARKNGWKTTSYESARQYIKRDFGRAMRQNR